jgi:hypothetical protein
MQVKLPFEAGLSFEAVMFGAKSSLSVIPQFAIRRRIKKEQPHSIDTSAAT